MKTKNLFLLSALITVLNLIPAGQVTAQTFTTLHGFTALSGLTNSDGAYPYAGLTLLGDTLYGTASGGGSSNGTVFAVNTAGTGFTNLHGFTADSGSPPYPNSDGWEPDAGLILSGNTLYGTAYGGGSSGNGTVFKVNTDGTGFTNLHSFTADSGSPSYTNSDGRGPDAGLILSGNALYGTASGGGSSGNGTVFKINTDGTGFTNLHSFTADSGSPPYTNSDGWEPDAGLILLGNTLYGTAYGGGSSGNGTVFKVNTDGTGFTNLHSFTATSGSLSTNSDGAYPLAGLITNSSGNTLYGTASGGGSEGNGTAFKVNTDGTGFTTLHSFTSGSDGADPQAGLILSGNTLYGTASGGGGSGNGTVFAVNTDGTGFTTLHSFAADSGSPFYINSDGWGPFAGLILSGNTLYGTASGGGSSGNGTVFSLSLPPQLTIMPAGANVILTWPTNAAGFTLQSTTNLFSPAVWTTNFPGPVVVNGLNTVTNPVSGPQQFYRLILLANPSVMALIPAGTFTMGNSIGDGDITNANPVSATVSAFYMDVNLVSYSQWQSVYSYATNHGYGFVNTGAGKGANHPVQTVSWYDCVKWCNARSAQAGKTPVYYTDAALTQVYTNGLLAPYVDWTASGYRLPTEAEWEKAARGGLSGQRFPWGNVITENLANYYGATGTYAYDLGPNGYNAIGLIGGLPYTSPTGSFAANGYGLYDMAGNVLEWCWDWYGTPYAGGSDPHGPAGPLSNRVSRGGFWADYAGLARCASRVNYPSGAVSDGIGFRCVRGF